jgi:Phage tail tube protein
MACPKLLGVKNIPIKFTNCNTGQVLGPYIHKLSGDELPQFRTYPFASEALPNGYSRQFQRSAKIMMKIQRDPRIPLSWYQGAAVLDIQVEMESGHVYTGEGGTIIGEPTSDSLEIEIEASFEGIDELLPDGALADA